MACVYRSREEWEVVHQRVAIEVDMVSHEAQCRTDVFLLPHETDRFRKGAGPMASSRIVLEAAAQIQIEACLVNGRSTSYSHTPHVSSIASSVAELEAQRHRQLDAQDMGELTVDVPADVMETTAQRILATMAPHVDTATASELFQLDDLAKTRLERLRTPLCLTLIYRLSRPSAGLLFREDTQRQSWTCWTDAQEGCVSSWLPCRDSCHERFTASIHITVPAVYTALAPGKRVRRDTGLSKTTFVYEMDDPVLASGIGFVIAEFQRSVDRNDDALVYFSPKSSSPFRSSDAVLHTTASLAKALVFYRTTPRLVPFDEFRIAFIDMPDQHLLFGQLILLPLDLLHSDRIIDRAYDARPRLAEALALTCLRHAVHLKTFADAWILRGWTGLLVTKVVQSMFGANEAAYRRYEAMQWVVEHTHSDTLPLYTEEYGHIQDLIGTRYFAVKSGIVMEMIETRVGGEEMPELLQYCLEERGQDNSGGPRYVSTSRFLKVCKQKSLLSFDAFRTRWIHGTAATTMQASAVFARKKGVCEVQIAQHTKTVLHGPLEVYVHETDKQVYLHEAQMEKENGVFEFTCHQKVRKKRKKNKTTEEAEETQFSPLTVTDVASTAQKTIKNDTPVRWIRIDTKQAWIHRIQFLQLPLWLIQQLRNSNELVSQLQAIDAIGVLANDATAFERLIARAAAVTLIEHDEEEILLRISVQTLKDCLDDAAYFYKVRIAVLHALAGLGCKEVSPLSLSSIDWIIQVYRSKYTEGNHVLPNEFSDFAEYFVQRGLLECLVQIRTEDNTTPDRVIAFVLHLIAVNDNSQNYYSDCFFVASLLRCFAFIRTDNEGLLDKVWTLLLRRIEVDALIPSYNHVITQACLEAAAALLDQQPGEEKINLTTFMDGYPPNVQRTAFQCLVRRSKTHTASFHAVLSILERPLPIACFAQELAVLFCRFAQDGRAFLSDYETDSELKRRVEMLLAEPRVQAEPRSWGPMARVYRLIWAYGEPETIDHESESATMRRRSRSRAIRKRFVY